MKYPFTFDALTRASLVMVAGLAFSGKAVAVDLTYKGVLDALQREDDDLAEQFEAACMIYFLEDYGTYLLRAKADVIAQAVAKVRDGGTLVTFQKTCLYPIATYSGQSISLKEWLEGDRWRDKSDDSVEQTFASLGWSPQDAAPAADLGWQWWTDWNQCRERAGYVIGYALAKARGGQVPDAVPAYKLYRCDVVSGPDVVLVYVFARMVNGSGDSPKSNFARLFEEYAQYVFRTPVYTLDWGAKAALFLQSMFNPGDTAHVVLSGVLARLKDFYKEQDAFSGDLSQTFGHIAQTAGKSKELPLRPAKSDVVQQSAPVAPRAHDISREPSYESDSDSEHELVVYQNLFAQGSPEYNVQKALNDFDARFNALSRAQAKAMRRRG